MKCQKNIWVDVFTSVSTDADEYNKEIGYIEKKKVLCSNEAAEGKGQSIVPDSAKQMCCSPRNKRGRYTLDYVSSVKMSRSERQSDVPKIRDSSDSMIKYWRCGGILERTIDGGRF